MEDCVSLSTVELARLWDLHWPMEWEQKYIFSEVCVIVEQKHWELLQWGPLFLTFLWHHLRYLLYCEPWIWREDLLPPDVETFRVKDVRCAKIQIWVQAIELGGLPRWLSGQCRGYWRWGFDPWVGKIHWKRKWQSTPVFFPGKSHGQRSLEGCSPWGHKQSDMA